MPSNISQPPVDRNKPIRTDGPRVIKTDVGLVVRAERPGFYLPYSTVKAQAEPNPAG